MTPSVTIAIPTYNRAELSFPQTLAAAVAQTYENLQILVSDNCSTDHTPDLVQAVRDPRLTYVRHAQNIGANNNFNSCIENATGDYFMLLPDDDLVDADFVETCIRSLPGTEPVGLIRTGVRFVDKDGVMESVRRNEVDGDRFTDLIRAWYNNRTTLFCCNTLINTTALREIGGYNSRNDLFQDALAHVQVADRLGFCGVAEEKASFRSHDGNYGSTARVLHWCEDSSQVLEAICRNAAPEDEQWLRAQGEIFFCRMNYGYALALSSTLQRYRAYGEVARHFNDASSKWRYIVDKDLPLRWYALKQQIKAVLRLNSARTA